jgi:hypothetical protein
MIPSQIIGVFRAARVVLHLACGLDDSVSLQLAQSVCAAAHTAALVCPVA